jgi:hypothetical protein
MNWNPAPNDFVLFSWKPLNKGQLIQPARGKLMKIVEKVFPGIYIARKSSWRPE